MALSESPQDLCLEQAGNQREAYCSRYMTTEMVGTILEDVKPKVSSFDLNDDNTDWIALQQFTLYIETSDSLHNLRSRDWKDKKVLTVAGSGEFPLAIMDSEATKVDIFDSSLAACFFTELKIVAAKLLGYEEYIALCATFNPIRRSPIFDLKIYKKIKRYLSPQAQLYFDTITTDPDFKNLFITNLDTNGGLIRARHNGKGENFARNFPHLANEETYGRFSDRVLYCDSTIHYGHAEDPRIDAREYDAIYISNAGYNRVWGIVRNLLERHAKHVIFIPYGEKFNQANWGLITDGERSLDLTEYSDTGFPPGYVPTPTYKGQNLVPGTIIKIRGLILRVVGFDPTTHDVYARFTMETVKTELF